MNEEPTMAELVAYVCHLREVLELVNCETPCPVRSLTLAEFVTNERARPALPADVQAAVERVHKTLDFHAAVLAGEYDGSSIVDVGAVRNDLYILVSYLQQQDTV